VLREMVQLSAAHGDVGQGGMNSRNLTLRVELDANRPIVLATRQGASEALTGEVIATGRDGLEAMFEEITGF